MISAHFSDAELACHHCGINACTAALVSALEALRVAVGLPITVDDAYRCAIHNVAVGGAPDSQHLLGLAADIKIVGMSVRQMYRAAVQIPAFRDGGIGVAMDQGYIHVDVRGHHARWLYDIHGQATSRWDPSLDRVQA